MRKVVGKYIAYVNEEYLSHLFKKEGAETEQQKEEVMDSVNERIKTFLNEKGDKITMLTTLCFPDEEGKEVRAVDIKPLSEIDKPKGYINLTQGFSISAENVELLKNMHCVPFGFALEVLKQHGKGMKLAGWNRGVSVRLSSPAKYASSSQSRESVSYCLCTDVSLAIGRETTDEEEKYIRDSVRNRITEQMTSEFLYKETEYSRFPWQPTIEELMSNSWFIVD